MSAYSCSSINFPYSSRRRETVSWLRVDEQLSMQAVTVEVVTPVLVPALLESPLYARYALAEGRPTDPVQVIDELVKVRCAQLARLDPGLRVFATFPETGLTGVPPPARKEQAAQVCVPLVDGCG